MRKKVTRVVSLVIMTGLLSTCLFGCGKEQGEALSPAETTEREIQIGEIVPV